MSQVQSSPRSCLPCCTVAGRKKKLAQTHFRTVTVKLEVKSGFASKSNRTLIKTGRTVIVKLEGLAAPTDEDFTCLDPLPMNTKAIIAQSAGGPDFVVFPLGNTKEILVKSAGGPDFEVVPYGNTKEMLAKPAGGPSYSYRKTAALRPGPPSPEPWYANKN